MTSSGAAGGFLTVNIGYGIGLIMALYVSIGVSGGHLNPAVTLAMALRGKLYWLKVWFVLLNLRIIDHCMMVMNDFNIIKVSLLQTVNDI